MNPPAARACAVCTVGGSLSIACVLSPCAVSVWGHACQKHVHSGFEACHARECVLDLIVSDRVCRARSVLERPLAPPREGIVSGTLRLGAMGRGTVSGKSGTRCTKLPLDPPKVRPQTGRVHFLVKLLSLRDCNLPGEKIRRGLRVGQLGGQASISQANLISVP